MLVVLRSLTGTTPIIRGEYKICLGPKTVMILYQLVVDYLQATGTSSDHQYTCTRPKQNLNRCSSTNRCQKLWRSISSTVASTMVTVRIICNKYVMKNHQASTFRVARSKYKYVTRVRKSQQSMSKGSTCRPFRLRQIPYVRRVRAMMFLGLLSLQGCTATSEGRRRPSVPHHIQANNNASTVSSTTSTDGPTAHDDVRTHLATRDFVLYGTPLAYHTEAEHSSTKMRAQATFDVDSFKIQIDNCSTRCISNTRKDFEPETLRAVDNVVRGIAGKISRISHIGTLCWRIIDDEGEVREMRIPNSLLVPEAKVRLLSPQHLAQECEKNTIMRDGTVCTTYADKIVLKWDQRKYQKTILLTARNANVGVMYSVPGYSKYHAYCLKTDNLYDTLSPKISFQDKMTALIADTTIPTQTQEELPNLEMSSNQREEVPNSPENQREPHKSDLFPNEPGETTRKHPVLYPLNLQGPSPSPDEFVPDSWKDQGDSPEKELLRIHQCLAHIPMARIQRLAKQGYFSPRLATCRIPLCQACVYGKLTRTPWRKNKDHQRKIGGETTAPGECVSVDQLESSVPGIIGQLKGIPTRSRYKVATVFVDHHSNLSYVHLQISTSSEETLQAKREFELYANSFGIHIKHYHADNGRFADTLWRSDVLQKGQRLTFSGVGAHHQNGRAEKRIRDLQDMARISIIHANRR
jgi:hypothetical protein